MINAAIIQFYATYASYLGSETYDQLIAKLMDTSNAIYSLQNCITVVEMALKAVPKGDPNHLLTGVKGVDSFCNMVYRLVTFN